MVERAVILAPGPLITRNDLRVDRTAADAGQPGVRPTLAEVERQYIQRVLEETSGDKRAAARVLGISVRTLQRMQASMARVGDGLPRPSGR